MPPQLRSSKQATKRAVVSSASETDDSLPKSPKLQKSKGKATSKVKGYKPGPMSSKKKVVQSSSSESDEEQGSKRKATQKTPPAKKQKAEKTKKRNDASTSSSES